MKAAGKDIMRNRIGMLYLECQDMELGLYLECSRVTTLV